MAVVAKFTIAGRKAWNAASSAVKRTGTTYMSIKIVDGFLIVYAQNDKTATNNVTICVPATDTQEGQFVVDVATFENIMKRRNENITFSVHDDETLSFVDGKLKGNDIATLPWNPDIDDSSFEMPHLAAPTFPIDAQRKIIAAMKLAAVRNTDAAEVDIQLGGKNGRVTVGSISNMHATISFIEADFEGSFLISEEAMHVIASLEKEPFSIETTDSSVVIRTENSTISLPVSEAPQGRSINDASALFKQEAKHVSLVRVKDMKDALADQSFLFEPTIPTIFTGTAKELSLSINGVAGKLEGSIPAENENVEKPGEEYSFGMRGADVLNVFSHLEGDVKISGLGTGIRFYSKRDDGLESNVFLPYYR